MAWAPAPNPWRPALRFLASRLRRWVWAIVAVGCLSGAAGVAIKALLLPTVYSSSAQLLFDPHGFKVFNNDLKTGHYDANAAINFVESQMAVLQSERVLSRVVDSECAAAIIEQQTGVQERETPSFARHCPGLGPTGDWARTLAALQRSIWVKRTERSLVVDVGARGSTPELAAYLAGRVVDAYVAEDSANRAEAVAKLSEELAGRLDVLRQRLSASEVRAEAYRREKALVRVGDRLLIDQRLTAATAALNDAQARVDKAQARVKQFETAPRSASALGALGADADTRNLLALVERRNATLLELAPLTRRLGDRHPAMIEARNRLAEVDRSIGAELSSIRAAARADLSRARTEHVATAKTVADLTALSTRSREAEIELRTLEQQVDANRKLLESFELRSRETRELGNLDSNNLRIVSRARPPERRTPGPALIVWGVSGALLGAMLATAGAILMTLISLGLFRPPSASRPQDHAGQQGPAVSHPLRAGAPRDIYA